MAIPEKCRNRRAVGGEYGSTRRDTQLPAGSDPGTLCDLLPTDQGEPSTIVGETPPASTRGSQSKRGQYWLLPAASGGDSHQALIRASVDKLALFVMRMTTQPWPYSLRFISMRSEALLKRSIRKTACRVVRSEEHTSELQ